MKTILKKIFGPLYYLLVDQYAFDKHTNIFMRIIYTTRFKLAGKNIFFTKRDREFRNLKDKFKGERCFIIGNGPSLNALDLTKLKNEYTFGVNAIYLNYEKMQFYPTFYVIEDYLVAVDRKDEINAYHESQYKFFGTYLAYLLEPDNKTFLMNVLRNYGDKKNFPSFSTDPVRRLWVGGSVTYLCLELAYYMGFETVYMIGFDHNYIIPKSALISNVRESGFDILSTEDDPNHFNPQYFGKGYKWHDPNVDRMEQGFAKAKEYFEADGREVINATFGGKLEVFKRQPFDEIFNDTNKA